MFQLYWVDMETGEIISLKLRRGKFLEHFANRAPCLIGMEACGGSQHWARRLRELGHEVRLLPAKMVRPFVGGNKSDAHDARAIWTAVQQPDIKTERAWKVTADEVKERGYNLDIKNPHTQDDDHGDPEELLRELAAAEAETAALHDRLKAILAEALLR